MGKRALHGIPVGSRDFDPTFLQAYNGSKTVGFLGANPPTSTRFLATFLGSIAGVFALGVALSRFA